VSAKVECQDVRPWHDQHGQLWFSICGWRGARQRYRVVNGRPVSPLAKPCPRCGGRRLLVYAAGGVGEVVYTLTRRDRPHAGSG
jgi:hypothetical protein